jgi:hypothetical protein
MSVDMVSDQKKERKELQAITGISRLAFQLFQLGSILVYLFCKSPSMRYSEWKGPKALYECLFADRGGRCCSVRVNPCVFQEWTCCICKIGSAKLENMVLLSSYSGDSLDNQS